MNERNVKTVKLTALVVLVLNTHEIYKDVLIQQDLEGREHLI